MFGILLFLSYILLCAALLIEDIRISVLQERIAKLEEALSAHWMISH